MIFMSKRSPLDLNTLAQFTGSQKVNLSKLGYYLFRLVFLPGHSTFLHQAQKPYIREDHFSGGRPKLNFRIQ
jgi:hypothetical protein